MDVLTRVTVPLQLLHLPTVCERTGSSRSDWYRQIAKGTAPRPVKLGAASLWPAHEIQALIAARIAGRPEDAIVVLVEAMHTARRMAPEAAS